MYTKVKRKKMMFKPDTSRVIARFMYTNDDRSRRMIKDIYALSDDEVKIEIIGLNGKKYLYETTESNSVNVSNLKTGLYFLNIYSNNKKLYSQKFLKL